MSNSCKYYTERTLGWMLNNKIIVLLSLLSFSLFVSTLALAGQKNGLSAELEECRNSLTTPVSTTVTAEPDTTVSTDETTVTTTETTVPTEDTTVTTSETTTVTESTTVTTPETTTVTESTTVTPADKPDGEEVPGGTGEKKLLQILAGASD